LNQTQDLSIPHPHISQKEYTGQQQPTPYYLNSNVPPPLQTISQNYQPNIPNQSQMQPNQQQMFAPPNIQQHTPTPIPPHPQHQQQHQSFQPSIPPQPNVSSYQQVPGYNSTPPPTSMYQQSIPPQQSFAPPPHVSPYGAIAPPPASSGIGNY
jgi:hypothetical protein